MNMNIFKRSKTKEPKQPDNSALAEIALNSIRDGVIITDKKGVVKYINPAATTILNTNAHHVTGLDYTLVLKLESKEGRELSENENPLIQAMQSGNPLAPTQVALIIDQTNQRVPVSISVQIANDSSQNRIIMFRDIAKELEEEGEQTEFISTASHEMRTPVATIDGYISLALNPQTATIDERARGYLTAAEKASKHLGKLFQDLLDVTKLDDGRIRAHFEPVEMVELVKSISDDYVERAKKAKLTYTFGSSEPVSFGSNRRMEQVVYSYVDTDFLREIMDNLIENAIKYTPAGGSIYVNVRGDGDRVLINVTDTGIGISAEDLGHIFQKFYRVDNSDTRTIGGTGLGLYLVKQRAEAMGGKVWAESAFGEGSTFYVSLPRITNDEYEKRMIAVQNQQMMASQPQNQSPLASPISAGSVDQLTQISQPSTDVQPIQSPATPASQVSPEPLTAQSPVAPASQVSPEPQTAQSPTIPVPPVPPVSSVPPVPQPVQPQATSITQTIPTPQPVSAPQTTQPQPIPVAKSTQVQSTSTPQPVQPQPAPALQLPQTQAQPIQSQALQTQPQTPLAQSQAPLAQPQTPPAPQIAQPAEQPQPPRPEQPQLAQPRQPSTVIPPVPIPPPTTSQTQPVNTINNNLNGENK